MVITWVLGDEVQGAYKSVRGTDPSDWEFLKLRVMSLTSDMEAAHVSLIRLGQWGQGPQGCGDPSLVG